MPRLRSPLASASPIIVTLAMIGLFGGCASTPSPPQVTVMANVSQEPRQGAPMTYHFEVASNRALELIAPEHIRLRDALQTGGYDEVLASSAQYVVTVEAGVNVPVYSDVGPVVQREGVAAMSDTQKLTNVQAMLPNRNQSILTDDGTGAGGFAIGPNGEIIPTGQFLSEERASGDAGARQRVFVTFLVLQAFDAGGNTSEKTPRWQVVVRCEAEEAAQLPPLSELIEIAADYVGKSTGREIVVSGPGAAQAGAGGRSPSK